MAWQPEDTDKFLELCEKQATYQELALVFNATYDKVKHYKRHLKDIGVLREDLASVLTGAKTVNEIRAENNLPLFEDEVIERSFQGAKMSMVVNAKKEVTNLEELIAVCKIDPLEWEIIGWKCKAYQGYIKNANNEIEKTQLFSIAASMRPRKAVIAIKEELAYLVDNAKANLPVPRNWEYSTPAPDKKPHLLVINPTDLHMGKFAWGKESGMDYDTEIATELFKSAIEDLLDKTSPYFVERIILTVGSDLLNADNSENTTTGGTPQTTDGRQQRTIRKTWQLMQATIQRLLKVAPVHVVVVNGNHDRDTSFAIGEILDVAFANTEHVVVDNSPSRRKYVEYGSSLIMFTHGDEIKIRDIPGVMAEEVAEAWGRTRWRCAEIGHLHDQAVIEFPGCVVRRNPALTATEDWHASKGFVGKVRTVHAQLWDREDGNIAQFASSPVAPSRMPVVNLLKEKINPNIPVRM